MKDSRCCVHVRDSADDGRHCSTAGRQAVISTMLVAACVLQSVLLAGVCSYVRHELVTMNSQVRQVMRHCRCRQPIISDDRLSHPVSPVQVNIGTGN